MSACVVAGSCLPRWLPMSRHGPPKGFHDCCRGQLKHDRPGVFTLLHAFTLNLEPDTLHPQPCAAHNRILWCMGTGHSEFIAALSCSLQMFPLLLSEFFPASAKPLGSGLNRGVVTSHANCLQSKSNHDSDVEDNMILFLSARRKSTMRHAVGSDECFLFSVRLIKKTDVNVSPAVVVGLVAPSPTMVAALAPDV